MTTANLTVRFLLELAILTVTGIWTWRAVPRAALRPGAAAVVVGGIATVWATVVHGLSVPPSVRLATQIAIFAAATLAIAALWRPRAAAAFAAAALTNAVLLAAVDA